MKDHEKLTKSSRSGLQSPGRAHPASGGRGHDRRDGRPVERGAGADVSIRIITEPSQGHPSLAQPVRHMETKYSTGWAWIVVAAILAVGLLGLFAAAASPFGGSYGMMGGGTWTWGILMMGIGGLVLIVILLAFFWILRGAYPTAAYPVYMPPANALDALDQRYARGELSREDYLSIRGDLTHGSSQP